ncbi:MAG: hypothetical protein JWM11_5852 [Planctomycetaceae bacterium]|nr:hypothetical protein [Planctomycetaceae bacterium]
MADSNPQPIINRPLVGVIGAVCLLISGICFAFYHEHETLQGSTMRVGIVMTALFFVLPKESENARWERLLPIIVGTVLLIAFSKKMIIAILPMLLVIGVLMTVLRPRDKFRPPRR